MLIKVPVNVGNLNQINLRFQNTGVWLKFDLGFIDDIIILGVTFFTFGY